MSLRPLLLIAFAIGGCASLSSPDLSTCDGAARRPANPHGSILSPAPAPMTAADVGARTPPPGGCA